MTSRTSRPRRGNGRRGSGDRGYNLVALMVAVTVLNVFVAMALPVWSHLTRRDAEEELVFRGLQYAEAIRVFQQRFQRPPVRLDELIEVEPRSIRQLWDNPLAENGGGWTPIFANQGAGAPGAGGPGQPGTPGGDGTDDGRGSGDTSDPAEPGDGNPDAPQRTGPIIGVFSSEGGDAIKTWMGSRSVSDWKFTVQLVGGGGNGEAYAQGHLGGVGQTGGGGTGQGPVNSDDLGRPFPPGVVPPNAGPGVSGPGSPGVAGGSDPTKGGGGRGDGVPGTGGSTTGGGRPRG